MEVTSWPRRSETSARPSLQILSKGVAGHHDDRIETAAQHRNGVVLLTRHALDNVYVVEDEVLADWVRTWHFEDAGEQRDARPPREECRLALSEVFHVVQELVHLAQLGRQDAVRDHDHMVMVQLADPDAVVGQV